MAAQSPPPTRPAFDRRLSLAIDQLVLALERCSDPNRRVWLRWAKLIAEHDVPGYTGRRGVP